MTNNKIIITGGAGFIGSNFLSKYVIQFPEIHFINLDLLTYAGDLNKISSEAKSASNYSFEKVDIRDIGALREIYQKYQPTDIIHFAAESHVDNSISSAADFITTNIIG
ncbi:GDP-mannose 4,6-dehydratase, partial [Candidatus Gracilibacteria bacterium]|nr:GDP-mannose 4,6-dehydratase [Candidatus Gracilibacteria bacterium]